MVNKNKNQRGITLVQLAVTISLIGAFVILFIVTADAIKERSKMNTVRSLTSDLMQQLQKNIRVDSRPNLLAPENNSFGGGRICDTYCTSTATWPSLADTGYVYNVIPKDDISIGISLFRLVKPINSNTTLDPNVIDDVNKTAADFSMYTKDPIFTIFLENGVISMEEFDPSLKVPIK